MASRPRKVRRTSVQLALTLLATLCLAGNGAAQSRTTPYSLTRAKNAFLSAYNAQDVEALRALLAEGLKRKYVGEKLQAALTLCRVLTHHINGLHGPAWGNRWHGWFTVEAEAGEMHMILEIDNEEKIIHLMISDDVDARRQQCWISHIEQAAAD